MELNTAKGGCLVIFFVIPIICGILPLCLVKRCSLKLHNSERGKSLLCYLNCFAGGVFLGTCLLSLLTEGKNEFEEYRKTADFSTTSFLRGGDRVGFFLVALIEKLAYRLHGSEAAGVVEVGGGGGGGKVIEIQVEAPSYSQNAEKTGLPRGKVADVDVLNGDGSRPGKKAGRFSDSFTLDKDREKSNKTETYTSTKVEGDAEKRAATTSNSDSSVTKLLPLLSSKESHGIDSPMKVLNDEELSPPTNPKTGQNNQSSQRSSTKPLRSEKFLDSAQEAETMSGVSKAKDDGTLRSSTITAPANKVCPKRGQDPINGESTATEPAMSFHTIFDGLAVGLQKHVHALWSVLAAIVIHKVIVSTCLGIELATVLQHRPLRAVVSMSLFAIMAPIGVAIGMGVTSGGVDVRAQLLAGSVLQAIATGAFLYVTSVEILGQSMATHDGSVLKVLTALSGFWQCLL